MRKAGKETDPRLKPTKNTLGRGHERNFRKNMLSSAMMWGVSYQFRGGQQPLGLVVTRRRSDLTGGGSEVRHIINGINPLLPFDIREGAR